MLRTPSPCPSARRMHSTAHMRSHDMQNLREPLRVAVNGILQEGFSDVPRASKCTLLNTDGVHFTASQTRQLSREAPEGAGFICDRAALRRDKTKGTLSISEQQTLRTEAQ